MGYEQWVRRVVPYTPGEQPHGKKIIKLNTNENPYPPAPGVLRRIKELAGEELRLYPDPGAEELKDVLARHCGLQPDNLYLGVGSDDVLAIAFLTFFNSDKPILFPDVTYSFYDVWAGLYRIPFKRPALDENFRIVREDYMQENGGIIFPNPNAPTGVLEGMELIEDILRANPDSVVIIDEAYIDFGGESCLGLIGKYENLLVVQTFSKSRSLAGLRIGFAAGNRNLIRYMEDVRYSFNSYPLNRPAQELGVEAVRDDAYFQETVRKIIRTRERVKGELSALGFSLTDSRSNFLFAAHETFPAGFLFERLKEDNIYVRHWETPRIGNYLRITVGTDEEMDNLLSSLNDVMR